MRSLSLVFLSLSLTLPCFSMEWEEVEEMAMEKRGRMESAFEVAEYGNATDFSFLWISSYNPELRDGLGRTLKDLARLNQDSEILKILDSLPSESAKPSIQTHTELPTSSSSQQEIDQAMAHIVADDATGLSSLLSEGLDPNGFSNQHRVWLLESAIRNGRLGMVGELIEAGADPNKFSLMEEPSKSLLMVAVMLDQAEIVELMLKNGADHLAQGNNSANALHDACYYGSEKTLPILLPYFSEDNFSPDGGKNGYPLQVILQGDSPQGGEAVIQAFQKVGFNFNDPRYGPPILAMAIQNQRDHLIRALLIAGTDPTSLDFYGKSTFDYLNDEQIILLYEVKEWLDQEVSTTGSER